MLLLGNELGAHDLVPKMSCMHVYGNCAVSDDLPDRGIDVGNALVPTAILVKDDTKQPELQVQALITIL